MRRRVSVGADEVAHAIAGGSRQRARSTIKIVRNGSRGMFWLEPLVEVETPQGRVAYGPVDAERRAGLFDAGFLQGGKHALSPRPDRRDPLSQEPGAADLRALRHHRSAVARRLSSRMAAIAASRNALTMQPAEIVEEGDGLRPARPRRRGLPDRHQVEDRARRQGRPEIHRAATPTRATAAPSPTA